MGQRKSVLAQKMIKISMDMALDEDLINEFRTAFEIFDESGDGSLQSDEVAEILASMGSEATKEEIFAMIDEVDKDESGQIEFDEFLLLMAQKMNAGSAVEDFEKAFQVFDRDGSGSIAAEEVRYIMANHGLEVSKEEAEQMIRSSDFDGDGKFGKNDFFVFLEKMGAIKFV
jgi:Ca2+-binding EF-hand superfamily protein